MHDLKVPTQELAAEFERIFGERPSIFRAPGRVNLIGEHTDYNDGFVMPAAIDFYTWAAIAPRKDSKLLAISNQFPEKLEADLHNSARPRAGNWTDYVWGVAMSLSQADFTTSGASLLIRGEVPTGAGLSSSAALEVATGFALLTSFGRQIDLSQLAAICQRAENDYVELAAASWISSLPVMAALTAHSCSIVAPLNTNICRCRRSFHWSSATPW